MPNITITLPNITQSVFRPIVIDLVEQVKKITKISDSTEIFFLNHNNQAQAAGSSVDNTTDRYARFGTKRKVYIEASETTNLDGMATAVVNRSEHVPVFYDKALGVIVRPSYMPKDLSISFRFITPSKEEARRWLDDMTTRTSMMRDMFLHTISYHYGLPVPVWQLLKEIWTKREAQEGYGQTFQEYLAFHSTPDMTVVGNETGEQRLLSIAQTQGEIIGTFEFSPLPEKPNYLEDKGAWEVAFTYKVTYDQPTDCNMVYPVIVHNQLLDSIFTDDVVIEDNGDRRNKIMSNSLHALRGFRTDVIQDSVANPYPYIRMPECDDYILSNAAPGTATFALVLLAMPEEDKVNLFSLKEMGDVIIDADILEYLVGEAPYIGGLYRSFIFASLYVNGNLAGDNAIQCDANLNLTTTKITDLRKQYRVRLSVLTDPLRMPWEAVLRLQAYPKAFVKILGAMNEMLRSAKDFQNLGNLREIEPYHLTQIWRALTGAGFSNSQTVPSTPFGAPGMDWGLAPGGSYNLPLANNRPAPGGRPKPEINNLFGIPEYVWNNYRNSRRTMQTVQTVGIVAPR